MVGFKIVLVVGGTLRQPDCQTDVEQLTGEFRLNGNRMLDLCDYTRIYLTKKQAKPNKPCDNVWLKFVSNGLNDLPEEDEERVKAEVERGLEHS